MQKHNYLQKDYTTNGIEKQLKIPFEIELKIEKSDPVILLSQYVEEMGLTDLYSTYERIMENQATPRQLLKILLYGYMNRIAHNINKLHRKIQKLYTEKLT